jgi:hypothetical protein
MRIRLLLTSASFTIGRLDQALWRADSGRGILGAPDFHHDDLKASGRPPTPASDRGVVLFVYFAGGSTLRRCPYISSSTYDTQLNSNNCMFFSIRRYSGMLIFQGRV